MFSFSSSSPIDRYTSIEQVFDKELIFIKLCGGFMYESPRILGIFYRAIIVLITKILSFKYFVRYPQVFESFSKATLQNVKLFWTSYHIVSCTTLFVTFLTGLKYHNLILVILKKRFDKRYIYANNNNNNNNSNHRSDTRDQTNVSAASIKSLSSSSSSASNDGRTSSGSPIWLDSQRILLEAFDQNRENRSPPPPPLAKEGRSSRTAAIDGVSSSGSNSNSSSTANLISIGSSPTRCRSHEIGPADVSAAPNGTTTTTTTTITIRRGSTSRIKTVRNFLILNVIFTTITSYLRTHAYARLKVRRPDFNATVGLIKTYIATATSGQAAAAATTTTSVSPDNTIGQLANNTSYSTVASSTYFGGRKTNVPLLSLNESYYTGEIGVSDYWMSVMRTNPRGEIVKFLFEFVQSALNINQMYGQLFIVLMITATITDMLNYSCFQDGLVSHSESDQNETTTTTATNIMVSPDKENSINSSDCEQEKSSPKTTTTKHSSKSDFRASGSGGLIHKNCPQQRRPLLTTELLVQVRDVLIVLRCTMSLEYLMLLIFDLTRLMSVFCVFNIAISSSRFDAIIIICMDYLRIAFSMSLTHLGYHWLHGEVRKLKRVVDERNLLQTVGSEEQRQQQQQHTSQGGSTTTTTTTTTTISRSERITTYRLADDIETLWPTDWFTPDLKSYLKHNIFVITFVATLQQLVDAGSKVEYQTNTGLVK